VIRGGLVASCSAWFIKNTNVSSETKRESKNSVKRKADGKDSGLKKRKVREGKKSNLGSLLNSFQGS
jgi:hypothetical protein